MFSLDLTSLRYMLAGIERQHCFAGVTLEIPLPSAYIEWVKLHLMKG
jgi:hypothetical protein